jgi:amino acid adenylation domain-containing protein
MCADIVDAYPLCRMQSGMYYHYSTAPGEVLYHDVFSIRIASPFDDAAFRRSIAALIAAHPVLRTSFEFEKLSQPMQLVHREGLVRYGYLQPQVSAAAALEEFIQSTIAELQPFDLRETSLLRFTVIRRSEHEYQLLVDAHHMILDGWSMATLLAQLFRVYLADLGLLPAVEERKPLTSFKEFVRTELRELADATRAEFWSQYLRDHEYKPLSFHPMPECKRFGTVRLSLAEHSHALQALAQAEKTSLREVLLAVHLRVCAFIEGANAGMSAVVANGRLEVAGGDEVAGLFLNSLPLRVELRRQSWRQLVRAVKRELQAVMPHRRYPFSEIAKLHGTAISDVCFNFVHFHVYRALQGIEGFEILHGEVIEKTNYKLATTFNLGVSGSLEMMLAHDESAVGSEGARCIAAYYAKALQLMLSDADGSCVESLLSAEEQAALGSPEIRGTPVAVTQTLQQFFEEQVRGAPQAIAVEIGDAGIEYAELNRRANRLAHRLLQLGVTPDTIVAICMARSIDMVVAMLAIVKAGGAYLPLDASYPSSRLQYMVKDAGAVTVVAHEATAGAARELGAPVIMIDAAAAFENLPVSDPPPHAEQSSASLAYVIYTSGSTGKPKGVMAEHRGVIRLVKEPDYVRLDRRSIILQLSSVSFDAATFEIWGALLNGGRLVLYDAVDLDFARINALIEGRGVNAMFLTTRLFDSWTQELPRLQHDLTVLTGGEVVNPQSMVRALQGSPHLAIVHCYGPTENTTFTTCHDVPRNVRARDGIPLGRAINGTCTYLLSPELQLVPAGAIGELYIGGVGLARGYVGLPELTHEKFIENPFGGGRLYKSGDLMRSRADGLLEFVGRTDNQIKIRGFRVELDEIQYALSSLEEVDSSLVRVHESPSTPRQLVAYVVRKRASAASQVDSGPWIGALKRALGERLPDYMVPSAFVELTEWPLKANGKVDDQRLPAPAATAQTSGYVPPQSDVERQLVQLWSELLQLDADTLGVETNFFELGGDSILSIQVVSRAAKQGLHFTARDLFASKDIRTLARCVTQAAPVVRRAMAPRRQVTAQDYTPADFPLSKASQLELSQWLAQLQQHDAAQLEDLYPATGMQQGMLFHSTLLPSSYVSQLAVRLDGLQPALFKQAWVEVVKRHAVLRTAFVGLENGNVHQAVLEQVHLDWHEHDCSALADPEQQLAVQAYLQEDKRRGFDVMRAPLMRMSLLNLGGARMRFAWSHHHALLDGWSLPLVLGEVTEHYRALIAQQPPCLDDAKPYRDYVAWLQEQDLAESKAFWRERLATALEPTPMPLMEAHTVRNQRREIVVDSYIQFSTEETARIVRLAQSSGTTVNIVLRAAWALLLSRYCGKSEVVFGAVVSGRPGQLQDVERIAGLFINTVPVIADVMLDENVHDWLQRLHERQIASDVHSYLPLPEIQRQAAHSQPLFDSLLVFENFPLDATIEDRLRQGGLAMSDLRVASESNYSITLKAELTATLLVKTEIYADAVSAAGQAQLLSHFRRLVIGLADAGNGRVRTVEMLTAGEVAQALQQLEGREQYQEGQLLHRMFEAQAAIRPGHVAAIHEEREIAYGELNSRANQLAHELQLRGVGPDVLVGLYVERSLDMLVGMLAILKAGGAYVPLAADYPRARVEYLLKDSAVGIVVTQRHLASGLTPDLPHVIALDDTAVQSSIATRSAANPSVAGLSAANLAYVIYTSGSTGQPKGVMIEHRNVVRLFHATEQDFAFGPQDTWVVAHSFAFDFSVWEIWGALLYGGRTVIASSACVRDASTFSALLEQYQVTVLNQTPSAFYALMREMLAAEHRHRLRWVIFGGEALNFQRLKPWFDSRRYAGTQLVNMYGITETTVHTTFYAVTADDLHGSGSVIGKPLRDMGALICNEALQLQCAGMAGELLVTGGGLARGYLDRDELTRQRFIYLRCSGREVRFYRTGDLVKRLSDGTLVYLGRIDTQVKIRGFRIELGEIANVLEKSPQVRAAHVDVHGEGADKHLVAYVVAADENSTALKQWLRSQLPEYMVPANVVFMTALPVNANGKIDRTALPRPRTFDSGGSYAPPVTETQAALCKIWQEVLERDAIGIDDNFFEAGGHSLLATRINSQLKDQFKLSIGFDVLFKLQTVRQLAGFIDEELKLESVLNARHAVPASDATEGEVVEV